MPFKSQYIEGWSLPFPGGDQSVVQRTEQFRYEERNERPAQIRTYFNIEGIVFLIGFLIIYGIFALMASSEWGRCLLKAHYKMFTLGMVSKERNTRQQIRGSSFVLKIVGKGWAEKLSEPSDEPNFPPNKTVVVQVKGKEPGLVANSTCLVQSGYSFLRESDKMPQKLVISLNLFDNSLKFYCE